MIQWSSQIHLMSSSMKKSAVSRFVILPSGDVSSCSVRHVRSNQQRIKCHARIISSQQRYRLLTARNSFPSQQPQLDSERTPQLRPPRSPTWVLRKPGPGALHVLAQADLIGCGAGQRVGPEYAGDFDRVEGSGVGEELEVREGAVVAVAPDGLTAGGLDC
jgi:hypothetical protein